MSPSPPRSKMHTGAMIACTLSLFGHGGHEELILLLDDDAYQAAVSSGNDCRAVPVGSLGHGWIDPPKIFNLGDSLGGKDNGRHMRAGD